MAKVLITKHINPAQLRLLVDAELTYDIATAVEFEISYKTNVVIGAIKNYHDWIFTSVNAIKSIQLILAKYQNKFDQQIFCVGDQAYNLLTQLGYFSVTKFSSEEKLKQEIDWTLGKSYTYFCNDNLKSILPENDTGIKSIVQYVEVYKSILKNPKIQESDFDYIFFFSPLAVQSILSTNPSLKKCHALCVGPATERKVKELGGEKYSIVTMPNLKSMIKKVLKN